MKKNGLRLLNGLILFGLTLNVSATVTPEVIVTGLQNPWALTFIDDGQMLVTERPGRLRVVSSDGQVSEPVKGLPPIQAGRQGGLLDIITDRDFKNNRRIYFCYTAPEGDDNNQANNSTALASAVLSTDRRALGQVRVIFRQTPTHAGSFHFGCRVVQQADGTLLLGLGDRFHLMQQAQGLDQHIGKVVRLNPDGSVPADNPFVGQAGVAPEIWSYGHRNIQGAVIAADGTLWMHEHGPQGGDELNRIEPGVNYGWPVITHGVNYGGSKIGAGITEAPGMAQPVIHWTPSIAPSGMAQVTSDRYGPDWQGDFLVGSLKFQHLVRLTMDGDQLDSQSVELPNLGQRVRDVRQGPDGLIYLLTDRADGQLIRLQPNR